MYKIGNKADFLPAGNAAYTGYVRETVDFTVRHQLMSPETWADFVRVFRDDSDNADHGWRCEFWGKMMRGACLIYRYNASEQLYALLESTVRDMLTVARPDGRISTYSRDMELNGWDVWGRKYVLTGMLHFYDICKDETLKEQILSVMKTHLRALTADVGHGKVRERVVDTSPAWGGVNSASILDAVLELYEKTGETDFLEFGRRIIDEGGCRDGNLIDLALENKLMPYQYPEVKAYETISFFEGLLTYYRVSGEEKYLTAVLNFVEAVAATDITVIGCSGCTHELFDRSAVRQTEYSEGIMQETCVTVTWMRMLAKLYLLTGNPVYMDRLEVSAENAMWGSINDGMLEQTDLHLQVKLPPLPFDSYSPLYNSKRGKGVGGLKRFAFGGHYGCCACIASAGIALFPLCAVTEQADGLTVNQWCAGRATGKNGMSLELCTDYPQWGKMSVTVRSAPADASLRVRIPTGLTPVSVSAKTPDGRDLPTRQENRMIILDGPVADGTVLSIDCAIALRELTVNGRTAFTWGPVTLARDVSKQPAAPDLAAPVSPERDGEGNLLYAVDTPAPGELVRVRVRMKEGEDMLLTDYQSCGKNWLSPACTVSVFTNLTD